jgi:hypothetical protein
MAARALLSMRRPGIHILGSVARSQHVPESSVEILGHSVGAITYRHCAHRAPLAFRAIMTLPQPGAFSVIVRGGDSKCQYCRSQSADAG